MKVKENFILKSDSYKFGHWDQYPDNTTKVYSYFEARKGAEYEKTVFFSLQYILKKYFVGKVITQEMINNAEKLITSHLGPEVFNKEGWQYILDKHNGKLPLLIKAIPEGTIVDVGNVLFTIENTDPKCFWLTNFVESILSHVWFGSSVATLVTETKTMLLRFLEVTSDNSEEVINFMFHNFGYRSSAGEEASSVAGAAHLLSFMGTDTVVGIELLMHYYKSNVCGFSVTATEHSVMSAEGKESEFKVIDRLFKNNPSGILSIVIDTYDYRNFIKVLGTEYKHIILAREGKVVFRPDSGPPVETALEVINLLNKYFGHNTNSKGYKVLNEKVGILWGDGIDIDGMYSILQAMLDAGWASSNIVFGQGGALCHTQVSRDMQRCAFKSSYQVANGVGKNIYKDPIDGSKKSKKGRLALIRDENSKYKTIEEVNGEIEGDLLVPVFSNGGLLIDYTFDEVKNNQNNSQ